MLWTNIILIIIFLPLCFSDGPYLLRSYPNDSSVVQRAFTKGPCLDPVAKLPVLQGAGDASLNQSECIYNSDEAMLTCKLGLKYDASSLELDKHPLDQIKVLILFVQEVPEKKLRSRVLDLCFIGQFGRSLEELAICGYKPPVTKAANRSHLMILDVPALAIVTSNVRTLMISSVDIWQSMELRQFSSLKHLLILQGATNQMHYFHTPFCADCYGAHPYIDVSFHFLIPLSSKITYFLFDSDYSYGDCRYDLLKKIRAQPSKISTLIIASGKFHDEMDTPVCDTCASNLCPLLAVCLEKDSPLRRKKDLPFECLCVEDVDVEDEFLSCEPMTVHQPMYSTRCNHTPSFWNYVSQSIIILGSYILASIVVFICSTIFLLRAK